MNDEHFEDALARELAAYQEQLERGTPEVEPPAEGSRAQALPSEVQQDLDENKRCLDLLHAWRHSPREFTSDKPAYRYESEPGSPPIERFQRLSELGSGGFGVVWRARDPVTGRIVALKVPRPEVLASAELRKRFEQEAEAAARLDHPNIVPILEAGADGIVPYIASVYYEGPTLAVWLIRHKGPVPPRLAAQIALALAKALTHAHERGVLHRDVKPSNVLLTSAVDGDRRELPFEPKLMDFGLAKLGERDQELTRTGAMLGTLKYMAPEQAAGRAKEITAATDVYGLGVVLYEMLAGAPPFGAESDWLTLRQVLEDEPRSVSSIRRDVPRDLAVIVQKCLSKSPAGRYRTARELADDLGRFLEGRTIVARPVPLAERMAKWCRRNPAWAALVAVVAAGLVASIAFLSYWNVQVSALAEQLTMRVYAADMRLADEAVEQGNVQHALEILQSYDRPNGDDPREFAWHFLWGRVPKQRAYVPKHPRAVYGLSTCRDESLLATACADGNVRVWRRGETKPVQMLGCNGAEVNEVCFSPDDKWLAAACEDGVVRVWDTARWSLQCELPIGGVICSDVWGDRDVFEAIALQPNGMILAAGNSIDGDPIGIAARVKPDGQLDTSFADTGTRQLWHDKPTGNASEMIVEPDGKIVVAGHAYDYDLAIARLLPDGTIDQTFAADGEYTRDLGTDDELVTALLRRPDGTYLLVGQTESENRTKKFALVRLLPNGRPDESFGAGGLVIPPLGAEEHAPTCATLLPDGRFVVAGYRTPASGDPRQQNALFVRFLADGTPDASFDGDGIREVPLFAGQDQIHALILQPDGKIVAAGFVDREENMRMVAVRLNEDGSTDSSFGIEGVTQVTFPSQFAMAVTLLLQPDGKLVLAGGSGGEAGRGLAMARLNSDGSLDRSFGTDGCVEVRVGNLAEIRGAVLQADGKLLVCGFAYCCGTTQKSANAVVARFLADGSLDRSFSSNGAQGVRFSPDSTHLIAYADYCVRIWSPVSGELQAEAYMPRFELGGIDAGEQRFVTAADRQLSVWDYGNLASPVSEQVATKRGITGACLLPSSDEVVLGQTDGSLGVYSISKGEQVQALLPGKVGRARAIRLSRDKAYLAAAFDNAVLAYRASDWSRMAEIAMQSRVLDNLFLSGAGLMLTCDADGNVSQWELLEDNSAFGDASRTLHIGDTVIGAIDFSSDDRRIACGFRDGRVHVLDSTTGQTLFEYSAVSSEVRGIAFADANRSLIIGYASGSIVGLDLQSRSELFRVGTGHTIKRLACAPSGDCFGVALDQSQCVQVRNRADGRLICELEHQDSLSHFAFTPNGRWLVTSAGPYFDVFEAVSGRKLGGTMRLGTTCLQFQVWPDGSKIVTAEERNGIAIRELPSCRELKRITGGPRGVGRVAVSADGRNLVSDSNDGQLKVWDTITFEPLLTIEDSTGPGHRTELHFSRDGRRLFGCEDDLVDVWEVR